MPVVIDIHTHPAFFESINTDPGKFEYRRQAMGLYKAGLVPLKHIFNQMNCASIDKLALLPLDLTTIDGQTIVSNDEIASIVKVTTCFIGFASIDPRRKDAVEALDYAFENLKSERAEAPSLPPAILPVRWSARTDLFELYQAQ